MLTSATLENIIEIVKHIYLVDYLDMAIVAYLVYKLIGLVRETRAGQLVKGALLVVILYAVASIIDMRALSEIVRYCIQYGAIVLVVLFQPELRKALERIGRTQFAGKFQFFSQMSDKNENERSSMLAAINAVCDGCAALSREKVGALIVMERTTKLGEIIDTGTVIDASPSSELIKNIFYPKSPLHDGALIIRSKRLYAAGCFLPLSENYSISRNLGTRHRAALGMSELSDAVVVVVSEETGAITVAMNSKLNVNISVAQLYSILKDNFVDIQAAAVPDVKSLFRRTKK